MIHRIIWLHSQSVIKNLKFNAQSWILNTILDNALVMQSTDSVDHPEWSTEAFDFGLIDFGFPKPIQNVAQTIGSGILNDPQRHLTALSKRYQESEVECKIWILKNYRKRCANHRFPDPEWSTDPFDCIIKALSRIWSCMQNLDP